MSFMDCYQAASGTLTDTEQLARNKGERHPSLFSRGFAHLVHRAWSICGLLKGNVRWRRGIRSKPEELMKRHRCRGKRNLLSPHWKGISHLITCRPTLTGNHYSREYYGGLRVFEKPGVAMSLYGSQPSICPINPQKKIITLPNFPGFWSHVESTVHTCCSNSRQLYGIGLKPNYFNLWKIEAKSSLLPPLAPL